MRERKEVVMEEDYGLQEIHRKLLEALSELDRICQENGICYSLHGGTLLGAVRNQKLIPWDDDLDISMTRKNYEKFKRACRGLKGKYYLNEIDTWVPRFATRSKKEVVFIDIFIWDSISQNKLLQALKINLLRSLQGTLKRNIVYKDYSRKNQVLLKASNIVGRPFSRKFKLKLFNTVQKKWFLGNHHYIHKSNDSFKGVGEIYKKSFMDSYSRLTLENKSFMVMKNYEKLLITSFGKDYMTPPPKKERVARHEIQRKNFLTEDRG